MSSRSPVSSPIRCSALPQHGQAWSSISTTISTRGRCAGSDPRVHTALTGSARPFRRIDRINLGLAARRDLLDLFQAKQHLILGQRLGAPAESMALQFLDDLAQSLVLHPLGNQHRLQRAGIVGERVRQNRHDGIRSSVAARRELLHRTDSLCRNHPGCIGAGVSRAA